MVAENSNLVPVDQIITKGLHWHQTGTWYIKIYADRHPYTLKRRKKRRGEKDKDRETKS